MCVLYHDDIGHAREYNIMIQKVMNSRESIVIEANLLVMKLSRFWMPNLCNSLS